MRGASGAGRGATQRRSGCEGLEARHEAELGVWLWSERVMRSRRRRVDGSVWGRRVKG